MATPAVTGEGQVILDGRAYRIAGKVQRELATRFAPKTVIGDYTDESNPLVSTATWRSWNGGFGLETIRSAGDFNRARWSSLYTRLPGRLNAGPEPRRKRDRCDQRRAEWRADHGHRPGHCYGLVLQRGRFRFMEPGHHRYVTGHVLA